MAIESGAEVITHAPVDEALGEESVTLMKNTHHVAVPTLVLGKDAHQPSDSITRPPKHLYNSCITQASRSWQELMRLGPRVPSLLHTARRFTVSLKLLADAGLSTIDVLRATTELAARHFGLDDRGVIEDGKRADLVFLSENPLENIRNTRTIERIWCAGVEYDQGISSQS